MCKMLQGDLGAEIKFERSAWHEAGHAALLLYFRRPVHSAWITDERTGILGRVNYLQYDFLPYVDLHRDELRAIWPRVALLAWQEMAVAYAGVVAEEYVFGLDADSLFDGSADQFWMLRQFFAVYDDAIGLGLKYCGMRASWQALRSEVRTLLRQPDIWRAVKALSGALLQRRWLSGVQLIASIESEYSENKQLLLFDVEEYVMPFPAKAIDSI